MVRAIKPTSKQHFLTRPYVLAAIVVVLVAAVSLVFNATRTTSPEVAKSSAPHFEDLSENDHHAIAGERAVVIAGLGEEVPQYTARWRAGEPSAEPQLEFRGDSA